MNLEDAQPGHAFEGDYPESYGALTPQLQQVLRRQLDELDRTGSGVRAAELLGILRGRRGDRPDLVQLNICHRKDGDCLAVRGEIVMPYASYGDPGVRSVLNSRGFRVHARTTHRDTDLVRLRHPAQLLPDVDSVLDECGRRGAGAWPNYIVTMAAVGKGIGGPEPVPGPGALSGGPSSENGGPTVAVIDTGIVARLRGDGWLDGVDRTPDNVDVLDVLPVADGYLDFQAGHGTFVAGIVQRVAPGADVRVYRAADTDGFASDDRIADAMIRAYRDGAQVVNLSLGGRTVHDEPPPAMAAAVDTIRHDSGGEVVIIAAAGNFGDRAPCWPAALPGVESVAGLTAQLTPARWSSHGEVRFSTVAEGIRSTFVTGRESPVFDREPETFPDDAWALWTGTSFAAPQIAGAVVRACRELDLTPRQAVERLHDRGRPVAEFGRAMRILEGIR
jgi:hypothetical protein